MTVAGESYIPIGIGPECEFLLASLRVGFQLGQFAERQTAVT